VTDTLEEPVADDPVLSVKDLCVDFGSFDGLHQVVDGVDLSVGNGEVVAIAGETGCGKSVTVKSILGLLQEPPAQISGTIEFDGENLRELPDETVQRLKGRRISMVFQDPMSSLNPVFTIGEQLTDTAQFGGAGTVGKLEYLKKRYIDRRGRRQARQTVLDMLEEVQMPDPKRIMGNYPSQLSGGMRQRAMIAQALLNEPDLLIADELGTALDVTIHDQILELLNDLRTKRNLSILMITHNLGAARHISDRVYIMYGGRIVETGATEAIFDNPAHPYTQGLMSSVPKLSGDEMARGVDGSVPEYLDPPSGCRFHPRCPYAHDRCRTERPAAYTTGSREATECFLYDTDHPSPYDSPTIEQTKMMNESVEAPEPRRESR
jgi:peptide/nickel transport system ATP-binding protein